MHESYNASITFWFATTLQASVAEELQNFGVDLATKQCRTDSSTHHSHIHRRRSSRS